MQIAWTTFMTLSYKTYTFIVLKYSNQDSNCFCILCKIIKVSQTGLEQHEVEKKKINNMFIFKWTIPLNLNLIYFAGFILSHMLFSHLTQPIASGTASSPQIVYFPLKRGIHTHLESVILS